MLQAKDTVIHEALVEKQKVVARLLNVPVGEYEHIAEVSGRGTILMA